MFDEHELYFVALNTKSKPAQAEIAALGLKMQETLALNEHLHEEIWDQLFEQLTAANSDYLGRLLIGAPTQAQLCRVLPTVDEDSLELVMELGMEISPELVTLILKRAEGEETDGLAYHLLLSGYAPKELIPTLVARVEQAYGIYKPSGSGIAHFTVIALATKYDYHSDEELVAMLERIDDDLHYSVAQIVDHRPSIIAVALKSSKKERFLPGIATSRHLTVEQANEIYSYLPATSKPDSLSHKTAKALADNPNVPYDLRAAAVKYMISSFTAHGATALTSTLQAQAAEYQKWFDSGFLPVTSPWQRADKYDLPRIRYAVKNIGREFFPTLATSTETIPEMLWISDEPENRKFLSQYLEPELDSLGQSAWTIFLSLLPNWQGDVYSLIQTTTHLARDGYKK